jgi:hypothetical protein
MTTNDELHNATLKSEDWAKQSPLKIGVNLVLLKSKQFLLHCSWKVNRPQVMGKAHLWSQQHIQKLNGYSLKYMCHFQLEQILLTIDIVEHSFSQHVLVWFMLPSTISTMHPKWQQPWLQICWKIWKSSEPLDGMKPNLGSKYYFGGPLSKLCLDPVYYPRWTPWWNYFR